jgi:hypothetical protein
VAGSRWVSSDGVLGMAGLSIDPAVLPNNASQRPRTAICAAK